MRFVATFHTHLSAMRTQRALSAAGARAALAPVPRRLSASCGTCVRYEGEQPCPSDAWSDEVEQAVEVTAQGYKTVYRAENS